MLWWKGESLEGGGGFWKRGAGDVEVWWEVPRGRGRCWERCDGDVDELRGVSQARVLVLTAGAGDVEVERIQR